MKVALVHDHLNQLGGAEKVLYNFHEIYQDSPIYTLLYDKKSLPLEFSQLEIKPSYIQSLPFSRSLFKWYLLFMPSAIEKHNLFAFDVILSSASSFAKGVLTKPSSMHVCYCHTPTRFLWSYSHDYTAELAEPYLVKKILPPFLSRLRIWDYQAAQRVDYFIANSKNVAKRIKKYYNRDAVVIYPPVEIDRFFISPQVDDYFVLISRFRPYKKTDLAIKAFNKLKIKLKIIGGGEDEKRLKRLAGDNIEFLGKVDDKTKIKVLSRARALIHPQADEDFGITAVEAMACGRPVIAYRGGGVLESVKEGKTGIFFNEQTWESLAQAVIDFSDLEFIPQEIRKHAEQFDKKLFQQKIKKFIDEKWSEFKQSYYANRD